MMDEVRLGPRTAARFAAAGALVLFLCWQQVQATRLGYQVESARKGARERAGRVAMLRVALDERLSPAEVAARASRLGMVPASPETLRRLPERQASDTAGAAFRRLAKRFAVVAASRS